MTDRRPNRSAALDRIDAADLVDPYPAQSSLLRDIDQRQWALLTQWGGAGRCNSVYWAVASGASDTWNCGYRIPPTITEVQVGILAAGDGVVTMTTDADATGIEWAVHTRPADLVDIEHAAWLWTSRDATISSADERRALTVAASQILTWDNENLEVVLDADAGEALQVYAYAILPIWRTYST